MLVAAALMLVWTAVSSTISHPPWLQEVASGAATGPLAKSVTGGTTVLDMNLEEIRITRSAAATSVWQAIEFFLRKLKVSSAFLLLVLAVAMAIYVTHARRYRRRHRTRPLTPEEAPSLVADLQHLARRVGISWDIGFECRPSAYLPLGGHAHGTRGRESLILDGKPEVLQAAWADPKDRPVLEAIALHELGHIANRDAQYREISKAIWISICLLGGIVPGVFFLTLLFSTPWTIEHLNAAARSFKSPLVFGFRFALMIAVVGSIWAALIRVRELYADWRVASWGRLQPLIRRLQMSSTHVGWRQSRIAPADRGLVRRIGLFLSRASSRVWQRTFLPHPSNSVRISTLQNPDALFRISPELPFLTGVLLGLISLHMPYLFLDLGAIVIGLLDFTLLYSVELIVEAGWSRNLILLAAFFRSFLIVVFFSSLLLALTYLVTDAVGAQAQREAIADLATGHHHRWGYLKLWVVAALLAIGFEIGLLVSPLSKLILQSQSAWSFNLVWIAGFAFLLLLWLIYIRATARLLFGPHCGDPAPRWKRRFISFSSTVMLLSFCWVALFFRITLVVRQVPVEKIARLAQTPEEFIFFMTTTSFVLTLMALGGYIVWTGVLLLGAGIWLWANEICCPRCGLDSKRRLALGHRCEGCGQVLARWLYVEPWAGEPV